MMWELGTHFTDEVNEVLNMKLEEVYTAFCQDGDTIGFHWL